VPSHAGDWQRPLEVGVDECEQFVAVGSGFWNIVPLLLPKDAGFANRVWGGLRGEYHTIDTIETMHLSQILEIEMRASFVPECQVEGKSAGMVG
jgi:hypothetical protein